jgi:pimeloyl-ACP methyl ester carboxylesterase
LEQNRAVTRRLLALVVLPALLVAAGCGGGKSGERSGSTARPVPHSPVVGEGRLVAIGGGRRLYLHCVGTGSPTALLEAGFGGDSFNWHDVQPQLGRITRTCAYDRAGLGNSVARPGIHDARAERGDLERLLRAARLPPPYVLVGHSYGGLLVRLFAHAHARQTAGIVLIDSMGRDQTRRTLAVWPRSQLPAVRRAVARRVTDHVDLAAGEALAARVRSLGDTPLVVITAGTHEAEWGRAPRPLARRLDRLWTTMQDELAAISPDSVHVVALRSDHFVQRADAQPDVVVAAVRAVVRSARDGARLPPCGRIFTGAGVRCLG